MIGQLHKPMTPGGGAFLVCVGAALLAASVLPPALMGSVLLAGFAIGAIALATTSIIGRLTGLPKPATRDLVLVWIPVAAEMAVFFLVMPHFVLDPRTQMIAVIGIVGLHFLPMVWSFGPLIIGLGLACMSVAAAGWFAPAIPLPALTATDGVLKLGFGLAMFAGLFRARSSASLA